MKDYLLDIVKNTYSLGIEVVKVTSSPTETVIEALADDKSVIVRATTNDPITEVTGVIGMPNLGKLNTILNIPEYKENATIKVTEQNGTPTGLHFENKAKDFKNDYRFMSKEIVEDRVKSVIAKRQFTWNVEFEPSLAAIQRLKFQASANSEELTFTVKTENNNLVLFFGDHSSHAGNFVFQTDITGKLLKSWSWPISTVLSILGLTGNKKMQISDEGVAQITVDTGMATYKYLLPAQSK